MATSDENLLFELKTRGAQSAGELASRLDVTPMGARKQLLKLEAEALVESDDVRAGVGRPRRVFRLTAAGHARFPDTHAQLTVELLGSVGELFGERALEALISARESAARELYTREVSSHAQLGRRVRALVALRNREGYMAECWRERDGAYVLVENHCPICAAARTCQGFCRSELALFRDALRADVERTAHLLTGARRCAYRIRPRAAAGSRKR